MIPNEIAGKYELRGTLGSGAMGTVYDAMDRMIERRVAIKVVKRPPPGDPEGEEAHGRFRREAQAAGRLAHPHIVGVYDYGENAETAWIVMELVEGGSLKDRLDRKERFPVPEIVRIMVQVLAALAYSHGRGVVHRDIKPGNIMLTGDGPDGATVKMADFGIARLENSSMTQVGTVMGTPSYMAPEQLRGETVDARADIWAAGVMLYQLLTGEKPFEGGFSAVMHKALHTEATPPSTLSVTSPRPFDAVIAKALAKRPEDRYASAVVFAEAIRVAGSAPSAPDGFASAGPLPGLDSDATMVAGGPPARELPVPSSGAARPVSMPARKPPVAAIAGGVGALSAVAAAAWFLLAPGADPRTAEQRLEEVRRTAEQQARQVAPSQSATGTVVGPATDPADVAREQAGRLAQEEASRTELVRQQAERARQDADLRASEDAAQAALADQARIAAEQRAREEAGRADLARRQAQSEQARRQADQRAREEAARAEAAREESDRARRQADAARQGAEQRAREEAGLTEAARRAEEARRLQAEERQSAQAATARQEDEARIRAEAAQAARSGTVRAEAGRAEAALAEAAREQAQRLQEQRRPDFRAAAAAAAAAAPCSLVGWTATDTSLTLVGVLRAGGEAAVRQVLAARNVPIEAAQLRLQRFDGPYCEALDILRPLLAAPDAAPRAELVGAPPLAKGDLLRLDVQLPAYASQLYVSYLMQSGEVAHLVPSRPETANARVRLGDPKGAFTGWEVDEPFGTDMILIFASDRPIFGQRRPVVEKIEDYLAALSAALRAQPPSGGRIGVRPLVLETVVRR